MKRMLISMLLCSATGIGSISGAVNDANIDVSKIAEATITSVSENFKYDSDVVLESSNKDLAVVEAHINNYDRTYIDEHGDIIVRDDKKDVSSRTVQAELDYDITFKIYGLNCNEWDVVDEYNKLGTFHDIISDKFTLNTPVFSDGKVVSIIEKHLSIKAEDLNLYTIQDNEKRDKRVEYAQKHGGKYVTYRVGLYMSAETAELFADSAAVSGLISSMGVEDVKEVKYVSLFYDGLHIIYIRTENDEYVIPYGRCDLFELEKGKLYEMNDFMNILSEQK